jgi:hypothetical protein
VAAWPNIERAEDEWLAESLGSDRAAPARLYDPYAERLFDYCHVLLRDEQASKRPAEGYETWSFVVDHVVEHYVPPKLRGALFDVAATVPGISVSKNAPFGTDRSSRR